jgi:AcrR family transcriptional regulator
MNANMEKHIKKTRTDKEALKTHIAEMAKSDFAAHGIKAVRMDDIASRAGISKRTLYELYADKESLLLEVVRRYRTDEYEQIARIVERAHNTMEIILNCYRLAIRNLERVNRAFFEDLKCYPKVTAFLSEQRSSSLSAIRQFYERGVNEGLFHSDLNYDIVCVMFREQMDKLLDSEVCKAYTMAEIYHTVALTHIRGIATLKGLAMIEEMNNI